LLAGGIVAGQLAARRSPRRSCVAAFAVCWIECAAFTAAISQLADREEILSLSSADSESHLASRAVI